MNETKGSIVRKLLTAALFLCLLGAPVWAATQPDTAPYDAVLAARARSGGYDYRGTTAEEKKKLSGYLASLGEAKPAEMAPDERKAFYINAYNVIAIETLLEHPGKKIIDIDGAFKTAQHRVGGEMVTLDGIENKLREARDARIHFAIVCASRSCPPLAGKAYRADGLSQALDAQGRQFVADPAKNRIDKTRGRVALSMIFNWNRKEFERDGGTLMKEVSRFVADPATAAWVASYPTEPEFLEYDWSPNQP